MSTKQPEPMLSTGDLVLLTVCDYIRTEIKRTIAATVDLASDNGRSLALAFDGALDLDEHNTAGGMLLVMWTDELGWFEILTGAAVEICRAPKDGDEERGA